MALACEQKGRYPEAIAIFESSGSWSDLAHAYAKFGRRSDALAILDKMHGRSVAGEYVSSYSVAEVYAGLGEAGDTLAWLERARSERSNWIP
jgi:tetratricopeptide (TPR) repeat protein